MEQKRIIYLSARGIGDLIFALPLLHSLHNQWPNSEIYIPMKKDEPRVQLSEMIGFISSLPILPSEKEDLLERERINSFKKGDGEGKRRYEQQIYEKYLDKLEFDHILIARKYSLSNFKRQNQINLEDLRNAGLIFDGAHSVDRNLFFAQFLDIPKVYSFNLDFNADTIPQVINGQIIDITKPYVVFNLSASLEIKKWKMDRFKGLAKLLKGRGLKVYLVGNEDDFYNASQIKGENVVNLVSNGHLVGLRSFAKLAHKSSAVISGDTGLLHLADATGAKVIGLFGPSPEWRYAPYNNRNNIVSRWSTNRNVEDITSEEVYHKLERILITSQK